MQLHWFSFVLLPLITRICAAKIVIKSAESNRVFEIDKAALNLIGSCYLNREGTVGIGGQISERIIKVLSYHLIPLSLIDNSAKMPIEPVIHRRKFRYNLRIIMIGVSTRAELINILKELHKSLWWNPLAFVLILYRSSQGCGNPELWLSSAWTYDLINAKIVCFDPRIGLMIWGFNPYTVDAPEPWRLGNAYKYPNSPNNAFAIYGRVYGRSRKVCLNLDFEKTRNLYGYPVEMLFATYGKETTSGHYKYIDNYGTMITHIVGNFLRVINGSAVLVTVNVEDKLQKKVWYKDMRWGIAPLEKGLVEPISRPFMETGLLAMTQHRGYMSQLQKILSVVDIYSNIGVCIVLLITLMFFKIAVRQTLMTSFLNVVRIVCDTGFEGLPGTTSLRIYLTSVLLFAVTMQGIYQGNLASLLTTEVPFRNVMTWQDLMDFDLKIYSPESNVGIFQEHEFEGRIIPISDGGYCAKYVLRDSMAACVSHATLLMSQAEELGLHLSQRLKSTLAVHVFRPNWPLEKQLNLVLVKLFEADIIIPLELRRYSKTLNNLKIEKVGINDHNFRNIALSDLAFAFVILAIGLTCASVTFVIEMIIHRVTSRTRVKRLKK